MQIWKVHVYFVFASPCMQINFWQIMSKNLICVEGQFLTLKIPTFFSHFRYSMETVCKSLKKPSKNLFLCFNTQLILVAIHCLTQFLKFLLINLRNQLLKNTFFQGGVKIHPPSGDKGLKGSGSNSIQYLLCVCTICTI